MSKSIFRADILKDKVVIITGGGTGIGFGIAKVLGAHGAKIGIVSRRQAIIDEAVSKLNSAGIVAYGASGDVRNATAIKKAIDSIVMQFGGGRIDVLVNNAAGNFTCEAEELSSNGFKTVQEIDLLGTFNSSLAALPYLKEHSAEETSLILNISATLHYKAMPFQVHASAAKAGIDSLTQTLGVEWGQYGIRVVGIAPGPIKGTVGGPEGRVFGENFKAFGKNLSRYEAGPLGKFGEVDDIANTALFLSTEAASYITATTIVVDGGNWHGTSVYYHFLKDIISKKKDLEKSSRKASL